jgi:hypothetical protein
MSQKTPFFIVTAVETSNLTLKRTDLDIRVAIPELNSIYEYRRNSVTGNKHSDVQEV